MDTRTKILRWPEDEGRLRERLADDGARRVVVGYFDPLVAAHTRRLAELAGDSRLVAVVTSPARPVLPVTARAELIAALRAVECVVAVPPDELRSVLRLVPSDRLIAEQASDAERTAALVRHIRVRQNA